MEDVRVNPDALLKQLQQREAAEKRGQLKIFFGYAAGVGKTYAMLQAAHNAVRRGVDVVAGYIEPHTRPDTLALLEDLELLPRKEITYNNILLNEFDLDAALARRPTLILVDELAHTNAHGCRHIKRYQDVEELLAAGIDVYTTVNVQHLESLNDTVASITGVTVRERIPDRVFDSAAQVELVDVEPTDLLERLKAGKIYRETQAQRALEGFFDEKNLTALREIALRRCADRVNLLLENVRQTGQEDYVTGEHILVCLSSSPTNAKIIRTAARMATAFRGQFTALFVETPAFSVMSDADKTRLRANIHLAEQLGAAIETVCGADVPAQIAEFSRIFGVTKIVLGRSGAQRRRLWSKPTLSEQLTSAAPNLDIHIIPDRQSTHYRPARIKELQSPFLPSDLFKSAAMLVLATAISFLFFWLGFSEANIITVYILGVLVTAGITSQRIYSAVSSVISVLAFNFFFTDPRYSFNAYDRGYPATFVIMFAAAFLTSTLAVRMKTQARQAAATAYRTKLLLETNQLLQKGTNNRSIADITAGQLTKLLQRTVVFYPAENGTLSIPFVYQVEHCEQPQALISDSEKAVAAWVFQNNKRAGASTDTLGGSRCLYHAVRVNHTVYGVVGIALEGSPLDTFENSIVLSILGECALALESDHARREQAQAAMLAKNEQLRANLLRSISHDLRTPLTSISGSASVLLENGEQLEPQERHRLAADIYDDSIWLINLVENLLAVTKIEDGSMRLRTCAELVREVVDEALRHLSRKRTEHHIVVREEAEVLLAQMDAKLIVQVLVNLLDNAIKYTPIDSEIVVSITAQDNLAVLSVADNGSGIPDEAKAHIFDMFYTLKNEIADSRRSLGLGLALCKSIILAHGGDITVTDNKPTGAVFRFTLPMKEVDAHESDTNSNR